MNGDERDDHYEQVARELQANAMRPGVWLRALTAAGGEPTRARSLYVKYRVDQLVRAERQRREGEYRASVAVSVQEISQHLRRFTYLLSTALFGFFTLLSALFSAIPLAKSILGTHWDGGDIFGIVCWFVVALLFCSATHRSYRNAQRLSAVVSLSAGTSTEELHHPRIPVPATRAVRGRGGL